MMDGTTEEKSTLSTIDEDYPPLSPIVEIDESSVIEDDSKMYFSMDNTKLDLETSCETLGDSKMYFSLDKTKLDLGTSCENLANGKSPPETPPEVLRVRLSSLQSEFEELKEFTDLEKQTYHSDCIPRDQVKSLEGDLASLNDKLQQLMEENAEYKNKLEKNKDEQVNLKSQLTKAWKLQNKSMTLIDQIKCNVKSSMKKSCTIEEIEIIPPFPCVIKSEENINDPQFDSYDQTMLNSLKHLSDLVETFVQDKKLMQDKLEELQSESYELKKQIIALNENEQKQKENINLIRFHCSNLENKMANIDSELAEFSRKLLESESKRVEAEMTKDAVKKDMCSLKCEMDNIQEQTMSMINTLSNTVTLLNDNFVSDEHIESLKSILLNSCDLHAISNSLAILVDILLNSKNELKIKNEKCWELQSNIKQANDQLNRIEQEVNAYQTEIKWLKEEIDQRIPSHLAELENSLKNKDEENLALNNNLEAALAHVDKLVNNIPEQQLKINNLESSLMKTNLEKSLDKESTQNHILSALNCLENIILSWDEKSKIEDLVDALKRNEDVYSVFSLLMDVQNQTVCSEIAAKYVTKLLLHDKNLIFKSDLNFKHLADKINFLQAENQKLRTEVNVLADVVRERINKVDDLEKLVSNMNNKNILVEANRDNQIEHKDSVMLEHSEGVKVPKVYNEDCDKFKKEINNLNKASKPDNVAEGNVCNLNEIENLIDSWDPSVTVQDGALFHYIKEALLNYWGSQSTILKSDSLRIWNKFEAKLIKIFEVYNKVHGSKKSHLNIIEDCDNNQDLFKNTIENGGLKKDMELKNELNGENIVNEKADQLTAIKHVMVLEITSLDESESKESLMNESLENVFNKLMFIIMKKENEMSKSIHEQKQEELCNFELTIENLNNKLKSQDSWTKVLESENDKINSELADLKSSNTLLDNKLQALTKESRNKSLEINNMNRIILECKTENDSLTLELDKTRGMANKYKASISSLVEENEKLKEENLNKSNDIKLLESELNSYSDKQQEHLSKETYTPHQNNLTQNNKGDCNVIGVNQISSTDYSCPDLVRDQNEFVSNFETFLSEALKKEIDFIKDTLDKSGNSVTVHEILSKCEEKLDMLKDIIQAISSKILTVEMRYTNDLQKAQSALDYKTKEMQDLMLSSSKLLSDFEYYEDNRNRENVQGFQPNSIMLIQKEVCQMKSECLNLSNVAEDMEESTKAGQSIVQNMREKFKTIRDENNKMVKLVFDLRKSVEKEQEKCNQQKQKVEKLAKEKQTLQAKNISLEHKIKDLKSKLSETKADVLSGLDISFPYNLSDSEKVAFVNKTLKKYSDTRQVCFSATEDLRFFGYQCQLMLSYIQTIQRIEYKQYLTLQQKEYLEKENILLKGQLSAQHIDMNRYFNVIMSKSPTVKTHSQALEVIGHIFTEHDMLKKNVLKVTNECKLKKEKMMEQQKELSLLTKENSSLKFELSNCEASVRRLRSELRNLNSKCRRESITFDLIEAKQVKLDASVQTDGLCCKRLQKKVMEQKDNIDILTAKLAKSEQHQRPLVTTNPYNKQVTYLEGALDAAKEKIHRLNSQLKRQECNNIELLEALKRHDSCQHRLDEMNKEIEKLKHDKWSTK
ncbi:repetitive organellar protein-like [Macrosteles quadrilineatus]|uniref:repetitive organellar protein-like n=1 Tax=Macrosteles quadrilineatus TaxID=74068 RepID=UPI0023E1E54F|nr:repetitive organellar protein-like [Macrosteles quadrilineatus]